MERGPGSGWKISGPVLSSCHLLVPQRLLTRHFQDSLAAKVPRCGGVLSEVMRVRPAAPARMLCSTPVRPGSLPRRSPPGPLSAAHISFLLIVPSDQGLSPQWDSATGVSMAPTQSTVGPREGPSTWVKDRSE